MNERDIERFVSKIKLASSVGECAEWQGCVMANGYGSFRYGGRSMLAHRFAYLMLHGTLPDGMFVCHKCDNRRCVEPSHLWLGTQRQNNQDMGRKDRAGGVCSVRKLSREHYAAIKAAPAGYGFRKELAARYGVSGSRIGQIRRGEHT